MSVLLGIGIPVLYLLIGGLAGVKMYRTYISHRARKELEGRTAGIYPYNSRSKDSLVSDIDRMDASIAGWATCLFWPLYPFFLLFCVLHVTFIEDWKTPAERELADQKELALLREQAKKLGLPMPGEDVR